MLFSYDVFIIYSELFFEGHTESTENTDIKKTVENPFQELSTLCLIVLLL